MTAYYDTINTTASDVFNLVKEGRNNNKKK